MAGMLSARLLTNSRPVDLGKSNRRPSSARWWCDECQREVEPLIDTQGPHCPWCQSDVPTPTERAMRQA